LFDAAVSHLQLTKFTPAQILERQVRETVSGGESLSGFVSSVASSNPVPGGGSVAAHAGALAAALAQMVAGLTIGKKKYVAVDAGVAALLAHAAAKGAAYNVRVNIQALEDKSKGQSLAGEAEQLVKKAGELADRTTAIVERALSS